MAGRPQATGLATAVPPISSMHAQPDRCACGPCREPGRSPPERRKARPATSRWVRWRTATL